MADGRWNDGEWENDGDQAWICERNGIIALECVCVCVCACQRRGWVVLSMSNCLCVKLQFHWSASGPIRMTFSC